ncbi:MAG: hypothetical protein ACI9JR_002444 [Gammaproteobacteria bacterium]|jgi:hypothetical protein
MANQVVSAALKGCMTINMGAFSGAIPATLSLSVRAMVTAGLANDVDEVNQ